MNIQRIWFGLGMLAMLVAVVGVSMLPAQRAPSGPGGSEVGRYVVVRVTPDMIVIMDSTTGELYRATIDDLKPYYRLGGGSKDKMMEKDRIFRDKEKEKMPFPGVKEKDGRPVDPKRVPLPPQPEKDDDVKRVKDSPFP